MQESYKRFLKTWIRFTNPWIRIDSKVTNPDLKRFDLYRGSRILILKDSVCIVFTNPVNFEKIWPLFTNPDKSLVLWHEPNPLKSRFANLESLWIQAGGFANPDSRIQILKIWFVDLFRKNKIPKLLDSFCFGRIRIRIPHPYELAIRSCEKWKKIWSSEKNL